MKNKRDVNYINPKIIIDSMSITGSLLEKIVNESLNDGEVTDILKISTVGPVPKTNRPKTAEDKSYSERSTDENIEDNELVSKWQSGYRNR